MSARTKARKRALDILFEADVRGQAALDVLAERRTEADRPLNPYTVQIVEGVIAESDRIDDLLRQYAQGWSLERMPTVDRNLLRIGSWELMHAPDVPTAVVIAEAVSLAGDLSTDDSAGFVNGVLSRIAEVTGRAG